MFRLEMLPARCGDCLLLEYGPPGASRLVVIDGGLGETAAVLWDRLEGLRVERGEETLEIELLVVTHIDNDHIVGIIELLKAAHSTLKIHDIWFNGRPQLMSLPAAGSATATPAQGGSGLPGDLLGGDAAGGAAALPSPADLLGPRQGDELSGLLAARKLPWNAHPLWQGRAVMVSEQAPLPAITLSGELRLTVLGPTFPRLYKLCQGWLDVLGGSDEAPANNDTGGPADLLGRSDEWPPSWQDSVAGDTSAANGSSIMLLAEHDGRAVLLAGDGYAPDLARALERLRQERGLGDARLSLDAFKLAHHGSAKNLDAAVLGKVDCSRYLISTDGSTHKHPDHQALLRILRHAPRRPELLFNYETATTTPWRDGKADVVEQGFQNYATRFPAQPGEGLRLEL